MDSTSPSTSQSSRRSPNSQNKKNERYRSHANQKFQADLDFLLENSFKCFDYELITRGKRALLQGDLEEFKKVKLLILKSNDINVTIDLTAVPQDMEKDDPVQIHANNTLINPHSVTEILLKTEKPLRDRCDPAECSSCIALPPKEIIEIPPSAVVVYAGPGSGKTHLQSTVDKRYRGHIYDTDHMKPGQSVSPFGVVFTNRPDLANRHAKRGLVFAFIPYRSHWMKLCLMKCPGAKQSWFADLGSYIQSSFVVRRNSFLSQVLRFRQRGQRRDLVTPLSESRDAPT